MFANISNTKSIQPILSHSKNKVLYSLDKQKLLAGNKEDFKKKKFKVLDDLILHCKAENIKLVFIVTPASKFYYAERHERFLEQIMPIINKYDIEFLDYAFKLGLSSEDHFHDPLHLNFKGATIFYEHIIEEYFLKKLN